MVRFPGSETLETEASPSQNASNKQSDPHFFCRNQADLSYSVYRSKKVCSDYGPHG